MKKRRAIIGLSLQPETYPRTTKRPHRDGYFTRSELQERWCCSWTKIQTLERRGHLSAGEAAGKMGGQGIRYYPVGEVALIEATGLHIQTTNYPKRDFGTLTRQAFVMFQANAKFSDIIMRLGLTIEAVEHLHDQYLKSDLQERASEREHKRTMKMIEDLNEE